MRVYACTRPKGFFVIPDFVSLGEEIALAHAADSQPWAGNGIPYKDITIEAVTDARVARMRS